MRWTVRAGIEVTPRAMHQASHCRQAEAYTFRVEAASSASIAAATRSASRAVRPSILPDEAEDGVGEAKRVLARLFMPTLCRTRDRPNARGEAESAKEGKRRVIETPVSFSSGDGLS
jgi:hypothetical protein